MSWRSWYGKYLTSHHWRCVRASALAFYGYRCGWCGGKKKLQVHHLNYKSLHGERMADLEVLCAVCHLVADSERDATRHSRSLQTAYETWIGRSEREDTEPEWDRFTDWMERNV